MISSGGPPKKVDWNLMPKPVRYFGYFFVGCIILMGAIIVLTIVIYWFQMPPIRKIFPLPE
jgi:hypothetical protein